MRFWVFLFAVEAGLLGLVFELSRSRAHDEPMCVVVSAAPELPRNARQATYRQAGGAVDVAFQAARGGLDQRLTPDEKTADLGTGLSDAILRMEGMFDPTRVRLFGSAMRLEVRPGTASSTDVFGDRWRRLSADPNLHRRVHYIAEGWLAPRPTSCDDVWIFRRNNSAIMLDGLTPSECLRFRYDARGNVTVSTTPVVAAPLSLPAFTAPYPGNRLSPQELRREQEARVQQILQDRWLHRNTADAAIRRVASFVGQAPFGRNASMTVGSVSNRAAPIKSRQ